MTSGTPGHDTVVGSSSDPQRSSAPRRTIFDLGAQLFSDQGRRRAKLRAKDLLASALHGSGADVLASRILGRRAPLILGYHRVVERFDREVRHTMPGMLVSRAMLEQHLDCIGREHTFVSLDEFSRMLERGEQPARPVAVVTFDDGYRDVYQNAFPLLVRKGIPAAVFVVSDLIGTSRLQIHDKLYLLLARALSTCSLTSAFVAQRLTLAALSREQREHVALAATDPIRLTVALLPSLTQAQVLRLMEDLETELGLGRVPEDGLLPMTWEMAAEMQAKGITIGSHSRSHAQLANEPPGVLAAEIGESRRLLESRLRAPVVHFAYPNGSFNTATVQAVANAGYRSACTACSHQHGDYPLLTLPRVLLWENSSVSTDGRFAPAILGCQTHGLFTGPRSCTRRSHR